MSSIPAFLAACGGGGSSSSGATTASSGSADIQGSTVNWMGYQGDEFKDAMAAWRKKNDITMKYKYIVSDATTLATLQSGGSSSNIDVAEFVNVSIERFASADVLSPLDESKIPNLSGLMPFFTNANFEKYTTHEGNRLAVPFSVTPFGIDYRTSSGRPATWSDLLQPQWNEKYFILDYPFGNLSWVSATLGYNMETMTLQQGEKCAALLKEYFESARTVGQAGAAITMMESGEIDALIPDGGLYIGTLSPDKASEFAANIEPTEGNYISVLMLGIPKNAPNEDGAYSFINEMISPKVNAEGNEPLYAGTTVQAATEVASPKLSKVYHYDNYEAFLEEQALSLDPPESGTGNQLTVDKWTEMYEELKA